MGQTCRSRVSGRRRCRSSRRWPFIRPRNELKNNRATYESCVKQPMGDFAEDAAARLAKAKIPIKGDRKSSPFRIHRDVRFAKNKDPYKTNAGVAMTQSGSKNQSGVLSVHLSPEECFFAAGFYRLDPPLIGKLRDAAARAPKAYKHMIAQARDARPGAVGGGRAEAAAAQLCAIDDPAILTALRQRHFICARDVAAAETREPALVDAFCAFASDAPALLEWGWDALVQFAVAGVGAPAFLHLQKRILCRGERAG